MSATRRKRDGSAGASSGHGAVERGHRPPGIDQFRAQHLDLASGEIETETGRHSVTVDTGESPLIWLARRKGRDGRPLIEAFQLQAGERLRSEFTRANMMPSTTSNWSSPVSSGGGRGGGADRAGSFTDTLIASRQRVRHALDAAGPEFSGLLLDVCCFLKRLEEVERERGWPQRSAKVVLQLGLDRLARHYGYGVAAHGPGHAAIRSWFSSDPSSGPDGT